MSNLQLNPYAVLYTYTESDEPEIRMLIIKHAKDVQDALEQFLTKNLRHARPIGVGMVFEPVQLSTVFLPVETHTTFDVKWKTNLSLRDIANINDTESEAA